MLTKEPQEVAIFLIDWAGRLGARTLTASEWDVPSGITKDDDDNTTTTTTITVSGGEWGESYELSNTITASDGEVETKSITVYIQRTVAYCTTGEVRRRATQMTENNMPNAELEALIEQASRMFDLACGVSPGYFNPPAIPIATERMYYGNGINYLKLDPYTSGSLVITYPTGYTVPDYIERDGYLVFSTSTGFAPPFIYSDGFLSGIPITASAVWGQTTPEDVKAAVIELVINLWRETDPGSLKLTGIDNQPIREKLPPRVSEIAKRYRAKGVAFV